MKPRKALPPWPLLCLWSSFIWQEIGDHSLVILTARSPWEHTCLCSRQWAAGGRPYPLFSFPFQNFSWSSPSWAALLASSFSSCWSHWFLQWGMECKCLFPGAPCHWPYRLVSKQIQPFLGKRRKWDEASYSHWLIFFLTLISFRRYKLYMIIEENREICKGAE